MRAEYRRWIVRWLSINALDGRTEHPVCDGNCGPRMFRTRREANQHIVERYGYIRGRKDLRDEPHGWRMPKAVRATITVEW